MSTRELFGQQINRFVENTKARESTVVKKVSLDIHKKVVLKTPVDTGKARANWRLTPNHIDPKVSGPSRNARAEAARMIQKVEAGDVVWITNNVAYIRVLEYGLYAGSGPKTTPQGYSTQAPAGMVGVSLQEFNRMLEKANRQAKAQHPYKRRGSFGVRKAIDYSI